MALTEIGEEIWTTVEDLQPFTASGYVVAEPHDPGYGGTGHKLHGLFPTQWAAHFWGDANFGSTDGISNYYVMVVWAPSST
jgi:hypothetical protein